MVRERNGVRSAFESELAEARSLLDETARDRARLQIESNKFKTMVDELHGRIAKLERELKDNETRRLYVESQVQDLQGKLNTADSQRKHWEDEAKVEIVVNFRDGFLRIYLCRNCDKTSAS